MKEVTHECPKCKKQLTAIVGVICWCNKCEIDMNPLKAQTESGAQVPCSDVLSRMPHTKDGKIILWGDKVYFPDPDKMIMDRELDIIEGVVEAITIGVQFKEYEGTHTVMFGEYESGNLELYSSRELVPLEPGFEEE